MYLHVCIQLCSCVPLIIIYWQMNYFSIIVMSQMIRALSKHYIIGSCVYT